MKTGLVSLSEVLASLVGKGAHIPSTLPVQMAIGKGAEQDGQRMAEDAGSSLYDEPASDERCERHKLLHCKRCANLRTPEGIMSVKSAHADPWRAVDAAESAIVREMGTLRCLADLRQVHTAQIPKQKDALAGLQRKCPARGQGALTIACLEIYYEWAHASVERALAAVYAWRCGLLGEAAPDAVALAQDFREGREKGARAKAMALYSDSYLILAEWIPFWNRRDQREQTERDARGRSAMTERWKVS